MRRLDDHAAGQHPVSYTHLQVRPWDVLDARVLETLATLPREAFVAESHRALAYACLLYTSRCV